MYIFDWFVSRSKAMSPLLVVSYAGGVILLIAGAVMKLINRKKKSEKLKNISTTFIAIGIAAAAVTFLYHFGVNH